jgi:hypothetical protein
MLLGSKSKMRMAQNWVNLEKHPPFPQLLSKLSEIYFCERPDKVLREYLVR